MGRRNVATCNYTWTGKAAPSMIADTLTFYSINKDDGSAKRIAK